MFLHFFDSLFFRMFVNWNIAVPKVIILGIDKILRSKYLINIFIYIHNNFKMGWKLKSELESMFIILKQ